MQIDKKNKTITAYHESGHAIVAYYTKEAMPINKATIMPRGPTLGHVSITRSHRTTQLWFLFPALMFPLMFGVKVSMLPENDRWSETRGQLLAQMDVSMGGRVAEELIFGNENITTGKTSWRALSSVGSQSCTGGLCLAPSSMFQPPLPLLFRSLQRL